MASYQLTGKGVSRGVGLATLSIVNFFTGGLYIWSVFASPIAQKLTQISGVPTVATDLGIVFGIASGLTPFLMIPAGYLNDRYGPKPGILLGGIAIGLGYIFASAATSTAMLIASYGILVGGGTGLVNGCSINSSVKLFPDKRGLAGGVVTAAFGLGGAVLPAVANGLILSAGISNALLIFGVVTGCVLILASVALKTLRFPETNQNGKQLLPSRNLTWREMLRTPTFVPLEIVFMMPLLMGLMLISSLVPIAEHQLGATVVIAAGMVTAVSLANTAGRLLSGLISDRMGRIPTLFASLIVAACGLLCLVFSGKGDILQFLIGVIGVGLCFGAFVGTYPGLVADEYGPKHNSVNFSVIALGYAVAGLIGPSLVSWSKNSGGFERAYGLCLCAVLTGIASIGAYLTVKSKERNSIKRTENS